MLSPSAIWKRLLSVAHRAGFTRNEAGVILFLVVALLTGGVLELLRGDAAGAQVRRDVRQALTEQDSVFTARSMDSLAAKPSAGVLDTDEARGSKAAGRNSGNPAIVDINHAKEMDLETLPGIGPATAKKIVDYRAEHGRFNRLEDIMLVKSIGPKKFEKIRQFITLE
jgi:comEA protein